MVSLSCLLEDVGKIMVDRYDDMMICLVLSCEYCLSCFNRFLTHEEKVYKGRHD